MRGRLYSTSLQLHRYLLQAEIAALTMRSPGILVCTVASFFWLVATTPIKRASSVPSYVTQYAPVVYLAQGEQYYPSDIGQQLVHTIPYVNYTAIPDPPSPLTLDNLNQLNNYGNNGAYVYLQSIEGAASNAGWFKGVIPDGSGRTENAISSVIITVNHGSGLLDAFYFYFYAFNMGNMILGSPYLIFGDHVGDWEHTMVRFLNGVPQAIWLSQHEVGEAFTYSAMQKAGVRPVVYSAIGTHANFATVGTHQTTVANLNLPYGPFQDTTSQGALWDTTSSTYAYSYAPSSNTFAAYDGVSPVNWLYYLGRWGDDQLPNNAPGQVNFLGLVKYEAGPTGPITKVLNRSAVCPDSSTCVVRPILTP